MELQCARRSGRSRTARSRPPASSTSCRLTRRRLRRDVLAATSRAAEAVRRGGTCRVMPCVGQRQVGRRQTLPRTARPPRRSRAAAVSQVRGGAASGGPWSGCVPGRRPCRGSRARRPRSRRAVALDGAACGVARGVRRASGRACAPSRTTVDGSRPTSRAIASIDAPASNRSANHVPLHDTNTSSCCGRRRARDQCSSALRLAIRHRTTRPRERGARRSGRPRGRARRAGRTGGPARRIRTGAACPRGRPRPGLDHHAVAGRLKARLVAGEQLQPSR